jgi:hypothetical protein
VHLPNKDGSFKFGVLGDFGTGSKEQYQLGEQMGRLHERFAFDTVTASRRLRTFASSCSRPPTPRQSEWLEKELAASSSNWKIAVFHQPIYSSGGVHGSDVSLREALEPFFVKYNVSVVLSGHDHFYERVKPQKGITYMAVEIIGDEMYFNTVSRTGQIVDSGVLTRRKVTL